MELVAASQWGMLVVSPAAPLQAYPNPLGPRLHRCLILLGLGSGPVGQACNSQGSDRHPEANVISATTQMHVLDLYRLSSLSQRRLYRLSYVELKP